MIADTLIVLVLLASTGQSTMVEAILTTDDSTLVLPAAPVHDLLGLDPPARAWTTVSELRSRWPPITVTWYPRTLQVIVDDPLGVLPATRRLSDQRQRQARGAAPYHVTRSGPFAALTADDRGRSMLDGGYSYKGRAAIQVHRVSSRPGGQGLMTWGVTVAPLPAVYLSYSDGTQQQPTVTGQLARGPVWLASHWTQGQPATVDGLVQWGRVSLFASTRDVYAVTINAAPVGVQIGHSGGHTTARVTYGPILPSPFSPPMVP